jgi:hypothetical protein
VTLDLATRLEIREPYARYSLCFDGADADGYAGLFTEDGVFTRAGEPELVGRDDLAGLVRRRHAESPGVSHHVSNISLEPAPEGARGRAYVLVLRVVSGEPVRLRNVGVYDDQLVRVDLAWRFRRRTFTSWLEPEQRDRPFVFQDAPSRA